MSVSVQRQQNEPYCEEVYRLLKSFAEGIEYRGWNNLTDWHQYAEDVMRAVLEPTFDYKLANANINKSNAAAIDLEGVDGEGKPVIIQVSSDDSRRKIQDTLNNKWLDDHAGDHLVFMFLVEKHVTYKTDVPFSNPHGVQFDPSRDILDIRTLISHIRHHSDPNRSKVVCGRLCHELKQNSPVLTDVEVAVLVNEILRKERRDHQSFQLIYHSPVQELLPKGEVCGDCAIIPNTDRSVVPEGQSESVPFAQFIRDGWKSGEQRHLFITGKGGIGKTVALLTFATEQDFLTKNVPAIYIPLYRLAKRKGKKVKYVSVGKYVREKYGKKLSRKIEELSRRRWVDGPNVILLLDGHNELPSSMFCDFTDDIENWAKRDGVQIVVTSRNAGLPGVYTHRLELNELSSENVKQYLSERGRSVPPEGNGLWRVLTTPLMLKVYDDVARFRYLLQDAHWLEFMDDTSSAGHLILNYLQVELYGCVKRSSDTSKQVAYVAALMLVLPYMCWKMERLSRYELDQSSLRQYVREGCEYWNERRRPSSAENIESWLIGDTYDGQSRHIVSGTQQQILTSETAFLYKKDERFVLTHQEFRDALAAVHLRNAAEAAIGEVPSEFDVSLSDYVRNYFGEIAGGELFDDLWETNRKRKPTHVIATQNLLSVAHKCHAGSLRALSFAQMDLSKISLFRYVSDRSTQLPSAASHFENTTIELSSFLPQGHQGTVNSLCFSPDGRILASGSWDGDVLLWDLHSRSVESAIRGNGSRIGSVTFSPSGNVLAYGGDEGVLHLLDPKGNHREYRPEGKGAPINTVCYSPGGHYIAYGCNDGSLHLVDSETCVEIVRTDRTDDPIDSLCFCDNEDIAIGTHNGSARLPHFIHVRKQSDVWLEDLSEARSVCFSPQSNLLASGSRHGIVRLWKRTKEDGLRRRVADYHHGRHVECVSFSPSGLLIASGSMNGTVLLWDTKERTEVATIRVGEGWVRSVCFSPDGRLIAAGSDDGFVYLIDVRRRIQVATLQGSHYRVDWAAFPSDKSARIEQLLALGSSDGSIRLWDAKKSEQLAALWVGGVRFESGSFSPNGQLLATGTTNGDLYLWNIESHTYLILRKGDGACGTSVSFSFDGNVIAFAFNEDANNAVLYLFDVHTHECLGKTCGYGSSINSVSFCRNGCLLVGSGNGVHFFYPASDVVLRNLDVEEHVRVFSNAGYSDPVLMTCVSSECDVFATASAVDVLRLFNLHDRQIIKYFNEFRGPASAVCFSPCGDLLACGNYYGCVSVWDTKTYRKVEVIKAHTGIVSTVLFSSDGSLFVSCSWDGTVRRWSVDKSDDGFAFHEMDDMRIMYGVDLIDLDLSLAIVDNEDCEILRQNGVKVPSLGSVERVR